MLQALEQHLAPSKPPNYPTTARHAWKTCRILMQEELQESDRFSAKNHRRGSSKLKGEGQSNRQRHRADLGHVLATFQATAEMFATRQTCPSLASHLKLQMLQVRERKGHGDSNHNTGVNAGRNKEQRYLVPS